MLTLLVPYALAAHCPAEPSLKDPDGEVTVLAQNLKFIITGTKRKERDQLFADYLRTEGADVDILLLSEARLTRSFESWAPEWCFYTQIGTASLDGYRWAPIEAGRPPGGLAMGLRQRPEGTVHQVSGEAGRRYRARPTSFAEGVLGRVFGFRKGWAGLHIDDTHLVWSHTQASYKRRPERGAGEGRSGRAGQFADLAEDLGRPEGATLITGDLNLLAGFVPRRERDERRVTRARDIDSETVAQFRERTGIDLAWPWARVDDPRVEDALLVAVLPAAEGERDAALNGAGATSVAAPDIVLVSAPPPMLATLGPAQGEAFLGTFAGGFDRRRDDDTWDVGAAYDRVGVNEAFLARHPGTRVRRVEIANEWMRVSDHLGLQIAIPFVREAAPRAESAAKVRSSTPRACRFSDPKRAPSLARGKSEPSKR
ncbi:MAG: endonuclease/exonuclease/phosphatase family protein [Myxococcota bacterium]